MQVLSFESDSLRSWAQFSGDFNPIHFDDEVADQAIGQGGVVVHGMLAMLSIKAAQHDIAWHGGEWFKWNAMLRKAMPLRYTYVIESRVQQSGAIRFKLTAKNDSEAKITGAFAVTTPPVVDFCSAERLSVDVLTAESELAVFQSLFPAASAAWVAIDAFVFSRYIRYHAKSAFQSELQQHFGDGCDADISSGRLVTMQTYHNDCFSKSMLGPVSALSITRIEYALVKADVVLTDDSLFTSIDIPVWINGTLVQVVQIGLMARKTSFVTTGIRSQ